MDPWIRGESSEHGEIDGQLGDILRTLGITSKM
jgi:hypothetical protein